MTVTAEIGGIALALQLATGVGPVLWIPVAAFARVDRDLAGAGSRSWRTSPACSG